jgi:hypothetical protein
MNERHTLTRTSVAMMASSALTFLLIIFITTSMHDTAVTSFLLMASHCPSLCSAIACSSPSPESKAADLGPAEIWGGEICMQWESIGRDGQE